MQRNGHNAADVAGATSVSILTFWSLHQLGPTSCVVAHFLAFAAYVACVALDEYHA